MTLNIKESTNSWTQYPTVGYYLETLPEDTKVEIRDKNNNVEWIGRAGYAPVYMDHIELTNVEDGPYGLVINKKITKEKMGMVNTLNINEGYALAWQEFDRNDRVITKTKEFKTEQARENFITKLEDKSNFYQILAFDDEGMDESVNIKTESVKTVNVGSSIGSWSSPVYYGSAIAPYEQFNKLTIGNYVVSAYYTEESVLNNPDSFKFKLIVKGYNEQDVNCVFDMGTATFTCYGREFIVDYEPLSAVITNSTTETEMWDITDAYMEDCAKTLVDCIESNVKTESIHSRIKESKSRKLVESPELKKVNVTSAKKSFENGQTVYLLPNKVRLDNAWIKPFAIDDSQGRTFDKVVNDYKYYNCNSETGNNVAYYIEG